MDTPSTCQNSNYVLCIIIVIIIINDEDVQLDASSLPSHKMLQYYLYTEFTRCWWRDSM